MNSSVLPLNTSQQEQRQPYCLSEQKAVSSLSKTTLYIPQLLTTIFFLNPVSNRDVISHTAQQPWAYIVPPTAHSCNAGQNSASSPALTTEKQASSGQIGITARKQHRIPCGKPTQPYLNTTYWHQQRFLRWFFLKPSTQIFGTLLTTGLSSAATITFFHYDFP